MIAPYRNIAAILAADVVGYSKLMGADETRALSALRELRRDNFQPAVLQNHGKIVKSMGDGWLVEFASVVNAVNCAMDVQRRLDDHEIIKLRIGIHIGDIVHEDEDIYGDGVNIASRLQEISEIGGIALSEQARRFLDGRLAGQFRDCGERQLKNIAEIVRIYQLKDVRGNEVSSNSDIDRADSRMAEKPSIAVLPFDNMSGDPEQEYFVDGIAEDIITDLSKVSGILVIARNSSFVYKGRSTDIREVCRDLGVRYVLEGSVRRAGTRVRINAQLIDGADGGHLWAERYDRELEDIFAVQDEVTREIVGALAIALTPQEQALRGQRDKVDPEVYDLIARARTCILQFNPSAAHEGRILLERAIDLNPDYALPYALSALIFSMEHVNGWNDAGPDHLPTALDLARKAIALDEFEPRGYHSLALVQMWSRNYDEARRAAERAIAIDPNFAGVFTALGSIQDYTGMHEQAIATLQHALRLDPMYHLAIQFIGRAQFMLGRYEDAEKTFRRRLLRAPRSDITRAFLASIYGHTKRIDEARRVWAELLEINPEFSVDHLGKVLPYVDEKCFERFSTGLEKAGLP